MNRDRIGASGELRQLLTELVGEVAALSDMRRISPWMTKAETAEYLGVTERRIQYLCEQRVIPHSKMGRSLRFHRQKIDEWLLSTDPTQRGRAKRR